MNSYDFGLERFLTDAQREAADPEQSSLFVDCDTEYPAG